MTHLSFLSAYRSEVWPTWCMAWMLSTCAKWPVTYFFIAILEQVVKQWQFCKLLSQDKIILGIRERGKGTSEGPHPIVTHVLVGEVGLFIQNKWGIIKGKKLNKTPQTLSYICWGQGKKGKEKLMEASFLT